MLSNYRAVTKKSEETVKKQKPARFASMLTSRKTHLLWALFIRQ